MLKEGMFIQGRYEIVGKIGTGGMADVYKAKDHKLNRFVAVKVLKTEFRGDKAFITKFRAEAQAAAGLAHPNIVNIYDVGEDHGVNFIVMELVEGITLKEYITKKGKLAVREATSIAIQVSQGLEAAHNSGIIHRDVKPQNIIISTDGKVKVTDFGIARAASSNTINTTVMGSVHYSSPEQARGGYSDAKSDIYSLGITMYEMLTGHVPFDGDTTVAIAIKHLQEEMKSPEIYVPDLPKSTVQIIYKCTQKSPDRRYADMSQLIYDLKESLINPDGDFVHIANASNTGKTVVISREELGAIKDGYVPNRINVGDRGAEPQTNAMPRDTGNVNGGSYDPNSNTNYSGSGSNADAYNQPYDPYTYGRAYGNRGYDYEEDMYENGRNFQEDDEDDGMLNPKLEKIMTVGSIVIAVIIACIFLGLIANALGIIKFSLPSILSGRSDKTTEQTADGTNAVSQDTGSAGGQITDNTQTDTAQTQTTAASTQSETQASETQASETQASETQASESEDLESEQVAVPDVVSLDYATAVDMMMAAGFYVDRQDEASSDYAEGMVISQSLTGTARPGSTAILIVSTGPESSDSQQTAGADASGGTWMCNAELDVPPNYNGETARLVLVQGGSMVTLADGSPVTFPYDLYIEGEQGMSSGQVQLSVLNQATGQYDMIATWDVSFERVD
ncbi:MAG: Stk1 family PASTA domain-containing Ser/Thr kinase [Eubacteriales bacterium]|nr:Stk1 family PASTA domain-containing Ser/Thr kinase [Eubacteriales bacterium]